MFENRKLLEGRVVSDKMDKTVVVQVVRRTPHPLYRRIVTRSKRYKAHDADNSCNMGDLVRIGEFRPTSREKRWRVVEIMEKRHVAELQPSEITAANTDSQ